MRQVNRRRSFRVRIPGGVVDLTGPRYVGTCQVINLSSGGILIQGERSLQLGTPCTLRLWLPNGEGLGINGRIRRCDRLVHDVVRLALEFREMRATAVDAIMGLIASELDMQRDRLVLVATRHELEGRRILAGLEKRGRRGVLVHTLLDAIQHLEQDTTPVDAVIFGTRIGSVSGTDFTRYLTSYYPTIRRIVIANAGEDAAEDEPVDAVLKKPWSLPELDRVLMP